MAEPVLILSDRALDLASLANRLPVNDETGAMASFTGLVRGDGFLTALELLHHPVMTPAALQRIADTARQRFQPASLLIAHRTGKMRPGEPIVYIAAAAPHRQAALDTVSFAIDVLKTEAPFWKREWTGETYTWIEPTAADHDRASHWLETGT